MKGYTGGPADLTHAMNADGGIHVKRGCVIVLKEFDSGMR